MTHGPSRVQVLNFQVKFVASPPQWVVVRAVPKKAGTHLLPATAVPKVVTVGYFLTLDRALLRIRDILVGEAGVESLEDLKEKIEEISKMMVRNLQEIG